MFDGPLMVSFGMWGDDTNVTVWMKQKTQVSQPVVESDGTTVTTDAGANAENTGNRNKMGLQIT